MSATALGLAMSPWATAQRHERAYWYPETDALHAERRAEEAARQAWYAGLLFVDLARPASVIELGAGPQGLLARTRLMGAARLVAVEPMPLRSDDALRYAAAGAALWAFPVEALEDIYPAMEQFEEVWMTNLLQHVEDPARVLGIATRLATHRLRLFEWVEEPVSVVHLHTLHADAIGAQLAAAGLTPEYLTEGQATSCGRWSQRFLAGVWRRTT